MVRLGIVSDLHCHPSTHTPQASFLFSDQEREPADDHPVESLVRFIEDSSLTCDVLLTPGDITDKIDRAGLAAGWSFIDDIASALKAPVTLATIGNHDVDSRQQHGADSFDIPKRFHPRRFPSALEADRDNFWLRGFYLRCLPSLSVLVINSVHSHFNQERAKRGEISRVQLDSIRDALRKAAESDALAASKVVLVHHHPIAHEDLNLGSDDLLVNGSELIGLVEELGFCLVIHGHKHYPRLRYAPGGGQAPTVLAAGSLSAFGAQMLSNTRNLFHLVELSDEHVPGCWGAGQITSWQYNAGAGWHKPRGAKFPFLAGFGCRRSPDSLADEVELYLNARPESVVAWQDLLVQFPYLAYVLPSDLIAVFSKVYKTTGFEAFPAPPHTPKYLIKG